MFLIYILLIEIQIFKLELIFQLLWRFEGDFQSYALNTILITGTSLQ